MATRGSGVCYGGGISGGEKYAICEVLSRNPMEDLLPAIGLRAQFAYCAVQLQDNRAH